MNTKEKLQEIIRTDGIESVQKMIDEISSNEKLAKDWLIEQINDLIIDIKKLNQIISFTKRVTICIFGTNNVHYGYRGRKFGQF